MSEPNFIESSNPDYVVVRKRVLYAYGCTYASCVRFLASLIDEEPQSVAQKSAQIGQFQMMEASQQEVNYYIKTFVEGRRPETTLIRKNSSSPDESV
jgi:hypothetical protein